MPLKLRPTQISDRDLLGAANHLQLAKTLSANVNATRPFVAHGDTVTLNLLAIRVEFQADTKNSTTGTGKFDLTPRKKVMLDPTPHDRSYFEAQLKALANYYKKVSNRKLILKGVLAPSGGDVYPLDAQSAYQLPHDMAYYGTDASETLRDQRLCELFRDAWTLADQTDRLNFSNYDCFLIFHAGVGADIAFDFDETPFDISSAFLSFSDLKQNVGNNASDFRGIPVQQGSFFIRDGIILPETQNQNDVEFGLLGTAALMFGSQIGLPSLFNVETGRAGIGKWGLMDQGSGNFRGLIPAQPCAWSKVFLGWEEPVIIHQGQKFPVAAALAKNPRKIYKIPINATEYFLIENRQQHALKTQDLAIGYDQNGVRVEFDREGNMTQKAADDTFRVLVSIDEYDFDCPGSGILIWHIDETILAEKYASNRVNTDPKRRGVDLEEAHGSQDLGGDFSFLHPAAGSENGLPENAFWNGNESNKIVNNTQKVAFTPTSNPGSWSNSRANSHISIENFSKIDTVMYFDVTHAWLQPGFPQTLGKQGNLIANSLLAADLTQDGKSELLAAAADGQIYAWNADGSKVMPNDAIVVELDYANRLDTIAVPLFAARRDSTRQGFTVVDLNQDGIREVVVVTTSGQIIAWQPTDLDVDGFADPLPQFEYTLPAPLTTAPMVISGAPAKPVLILGLASGEVLALNYDGILWRQPVVSAAIQSLAYLEPATQIIATSANEISLLDVSGKILWNQSLGLNARAGLAVVGDLDHDSQPEIVVPLSDGTMVIFSATGAEKLRFHVPLTTSQLPELALGDVNRDGYLEIVTGLQDQLLVFGYNGVLLENFPVKLNWTAPATDFKYPAPALGDLDGDGDLEIVTGTAAGDVLAFHHTGEMVTGFPLSMAVAPLTTPLLTDLDQDQLIEIVGLSAAKSLYVWELPGKYDAAAIAWGSPRGNPARHAYASTSVQPGAAAGEFLSLAYNYPNPTEGNFTTIRYHLSTAAKVTIDIFDLAGELIASLVGPGVAQMPNEVIWSLAQVENGVYLARIQATRLDGAPPATVFIKIAVVK
ncbi:T9SS type A sorting domain-containing protein [candidate division KSB1 bacterium]|nr:T9SS type A sorting domain-containing protein [candidate division KSB1 bacterium]